MTLPIHIPAGKPDPYRAVSRRSVAQAGLEIALGYAGAHVSEEGGNNRGDQVEFFQRLMSGAPGDAWCADFVCTCLVKGYARRTGQAEARQNLPGFVHAAGEILISLSGYCPALAESARRRYCFRSPEFDPAPGDLVLFDFPRIGEPHHVGFVRSVRSDGTLHTVEGNTSSGAAGSQSDGDGVFCRERSRDRVFGFVHFG